MSQPSFVHLRMHSEFSVSDAINCARDDAQGVKPILGADILVANADDATAPHRMLLLVKNHGGHLFDECAAVKKSSKRGSKTWRQRGHQAGVGLTDFTDRRDDGKINRNERGLLG